MKKAVLRILFIIIIIFILFNILAFLGISIAHGRVFARADYEKYDSNRYLRYDDIDKQAYPRETLKISAGNHALNGFLYGAENKKGLIIVSPGHRDPNDVKLYEIMYFVDNGWMVLCYDYTGCYSSEGNSMIGYVQAPKDLNTVIDYVETNTRFGNIPVLLFGHSLGGYASTAVLQFGNKVTAIVAASGFDDPKEQWDYSVKKSTGFLGLILEPYAGIYMELKFGDEAHLSAIDGINSTDIPVLVISGTDDEYYGGKSMIYIKKDKIANENCEFVLMDKSDHNGHYDYFLTNEAVQYQAQVKNGQIEKVNKFLYCEHDKNIMDMINDFYMKAIESR